MLQRKEVKDLFDKESLSKFYMYELQKVFCTAPDVKSFPNLVELIER